MSAWHLESKKRTPQLARNRTLLLRIVFFDMNSADLWNYYDGQIKYGSTYSYRVYAYYLVAGYRYRYRDLVLSRTIGTTIHTGTDVDFCGEFYNPSTGDAEASPLKLNHL